MERNLNTFAEAHSVHEVGARVVPGERLARRTHPLLRTWTLFTAVLFALFAAWSLATPIGAIIDEPAHLVKAASVVRGELNGPALTEKSKARLSAQYRQSLQYCDSVSGSERCDRAISTVTVPQSFATFQTNCFPTVPWCSRGLRGAGTETEAATYVGHYPPLYYSVVGLPSLAWHSNVAVYLMRLLSCLINALFLGLALALAAVWSRSRLLLPALALSATPMVLIVGSVVNPSGLEIATSACVWSGGLILVLDRMDGPPVSLVAATTAAAAVMVLMRGLSPLWLAIIAVALAFLAPRSLTALLRSTSIRIGAGVVSVAGLFAIVYILWAHTLTVLPIGQPVPRGTSQWGVLDLALRRSDALLRQLVGSFSWNSPWFVMALWVVSALTIVVLGLTTSARRHAAVIVALIMVSFVLPTALMVSQARKDGIVWQARDGFPLYVGILLVAGAVSGRRAGDRGSAMASITGWAGRRVVALVVATVAVAQVVDFAWSLRTYTVGRLGPINPFAHVRGAWSPPGSAELLAAVALVATVLYVWLIASRSPRWTSIEPSPSVASSAPSTREASPAGGLTSLAETSPSSREPLVQE